MSSALADLLDKPEQLVSIAIKKIEDLNGNPSEDVRLLAASEQKSRTKIADLGLDPDDTTGEELYHALKAKFLADNEQLSRALNIGPETSVQEKADRALQLVASGAHLQQMWLLKHTSIRKLLRQVPPKKLMKQLKYRSLDSFIKREDPEIAYLAATQIETKAWRTKAEKIVERMSPADFDVREPNLVAIPEKYWQNSSTHTGDVISDARVGIVAFWPASLPKHAQILALAIELASELEKICGVQYLDRISNFNPALRWWAENQCLISRHEDGPVSLNIKDAVTDHLQNNDYQSRSNRHGTQALLGNLVGRYQVQSEKMTEALKQIGYTLESEISNSEPPPGARLAAEYAQAE